MEILKIALYLLGGVAVLSYGADFFVRSASHIAKRLGVSPVVIGLTIVAFGTSAPELVVNIIAAVNGSTDLAVGNVVGSNIFNVAFILGICAMIKPLFVSSQLIRIDIPIMVGTSALLWFMAQNNHLNRAEGMVLLAGIILYTLLQVKMALSGKNAEQEYNKEYSDPGNLGKDSLILVGGLIGLVGGAHFFVEGAVMGARLLGWSEALIGLTIIAAGTSLPEVATSVAATLKGERDIAIGNVVGSNIFNILGALGLSSIISSKGLPLNDHMAQVDITVMVLLAFICLPFCIWRKQLDRLLGLFFVLSWAGYTYYLIMQN